MASQERNFKSTGTAGWNLRQKSTSSSFEQLNLSFSMRIIGKALLKASSAPKTIILKNCSSTMGKMFFFFCSYPPKTHTRIQHQTCTRTPYVYVAVKYGFEVCLCVHGGYEQFLYLLPRHKTDAASTHFDAQNRREHKRRTQFINNCLTNHQQFLSDVR